MNRIQRLAQVVEFIDGCANFDGITTAKGKFIGFYTLATDVFGDTNAAYSFLKAATQLGWLSYQKNQVGTGFYEVITVNHKAREALSK